MFSLHHAVFRGLIYIGLSIPFIFVICTIIFCFSRRSNSKKNVRVSSPKTLNGSLKRNHQPVIIDIEPKLQVPSKTGLLHSTGSQINIGSEENYSRSSIYANYQAIANNCYDKKFSDFKNPTVQLWQLTYYNTASDISISDVNKIKRPDPSQVIHDFEVMKSEIQFQERENSYSGANTSSVKIIQYDNDNRITSNDTSETQLLKSYGGEENKTCKEMKAGQMEVHHRAETKYDSTKWKRSYEPKYSSSTPVQKTKPPKVAHTPTSFIFDRNIIDDKKLQFKRKLSQSTQTTNVDKDSATQLCNTSHKGCGCTAFLDRTASRKIPPKFLDIGDKEKHYQERRNYNRGNSLKIYEPVGARGHGSSRPSIVLNIGTNYTSTASSPRQHDITSQNDTEESNYQDSGEEKVQTKAKRQSSATEKDQQSFPEDVLAETKQAKNLKKDAKSRLKSDYPDIHENIRERSIQVVSAVDEFIQKGGIKNMRIINKKHLDAKWNETQPSSSTLVEK